MRIVLAQFSGTSKSGGLLGLREDGALMDKENSPSPNAQSTYPYLVHTLPVTAGSESPETGVFAQALSMAVAAWWITEKTKGQQVKSVIVANTAFTWKPAYSPYSVRELMKDL